MEKKIFNEKIKEMIEQNITAEAKVLLQQVRKNNNVLLDGIIIQMPDSNVSPTIYLESFYELYKQGVELENIVAEILAVYYKGRPGKTLNLDFFKDFEKVKERIVYRLINAEKNRELLKEIPHVLLEDLAICFYYAFYDEQLGEGSITIHNKHMEWWGTNHQELMRLAVENTPKLFGVEHKNLKEVMAQYCEELPEYIMQEDCDYYVLTNKQKTNGAACMLYEGVLEEMSEVLGGSFFIIPSSVHEIIMLKDTGKERAEDLHLMIKEVNEKHLLVEEVLSDYPYYYDQVHKKLSCLNNF